MLFRRSSEEQLIIFKGTDDVHLLNKVLLFHTHVHSDGTLRRSGEGLVFVDTYHQTLLSNELLLLRNPQVISNKIWHIFYNSEFGFLGNPICSEALPSE